MEKLVIESAYSKMWIEDEILHCVYKPNLEINLAIAKMIVKDRLMISDGVDRLFLLDVSNLISVDLEALKYLATTDGTKHIAAGAIYTTSPISKFAGKLFIDTSGPKPPAQLFVNKREAIVWLKQYKENKQELVSVG